MAEQINGNKLCKVGQARFLPTQSALLSEKHYRKVRSLGEVCKKSKSESEAC